MRTPQLTRTAPLDLATRLDAAVAAGDWRNATATVYEARAGLIRGTRARDDKKLENLGAALARAGQAAAKAERWSFVVLLHSFEKLPLPALTEALRAGGLTELHPPAVKRSTNKDQVTVSRPYAEYERAGFLVFSEIRYGEASAIKEALARNLPDGVKLVVYDSYSTPQSAQRLRDELAQWMDPSRVIIVNVAPSDEDLWARDCLPIPVYGSDGNGGEKVMLVDARNWHGAEPDDEVAQSLGMRLLRHDYSLEGGNFCPDARGSLFTIDKDKIPDDVFRKYYGCTDVARLQHLSGIGHVDERIKILSPTVAVTDTPEYVPDLEKRGYKVVMLPKPPGCETYVNSLLVNGTVFLPVFGHESDREAQQIYESLGFKVVPQPSNELSNKYLGSIHCITMTYPPVSDEKALFAALRAKKVKIPN